MLSECKAVEEYESFRRLEKKHPDDDYWKGAVQACKDILQIKEVKK